MPVVWGVPTRLIWAEDWSFNSASAFPRTLWTPQSFLCPQLPGLEETVKAWKMDELPDFA